MGAPYGEFNDRKGYPSRYKFIYRDEVQFDINDLVYCTTSGTKRDFHTNNLRTLIPSTSTHWIPPSNYVNSMFKNHQTPSSRRIYVPDDHGYDLSFEGPVDFGFNSQLFQHYGSARMEVQGNLHAQAITECLLKIQDQKVNLGENAATAKQTLNLITDTAIGLFKGLRALKHGDLGTLKSLWGSPTKGAANAWLAYIYGWKPLMQDIHGGFEILKSLTPAAKLIHARRRIVQDMAQGVRRYDAGQGIHIETDEKSALCTVTCHITAQVNNSIEYDAGRAGLINPLSVAWELVPFSFLVDWCMPVGNVIQGFDAFAGLDFVGGYISQRGVGNFTVREDYSGTLWTGTPARGDGYKMCYERAAFLKAPMPSLYVKNPLSPIHGANALALFRSLIN